jgi:hypothetical protein
LANVTWDFRTQRVPMNTIDVTNIAHELEWLGSDSGWIAGNPEVIRFG